MKNCFLSLIAILFISSVGDLVLVASLVAIGFIVMVGVDIWSI
jgi:hypothetical protein